jgi:lipid-A-disaccharide synthase
MTLRLARFAKSRGFKVMYYVSPQVWAWGRNRVKTIRKNVDRMVVILPFETDFYGEHGIEASYVGHPLIDVVKTELDREDFLRAMGMSGKGRLIALMPGSRPQEIRNHMKPLLRTADILRRKSPDIGFVVISLPTIENLIRETIRPEQDGISITSRYGYDALKYSDLAIACSGTATLEAALLGTPMIVIYRLASFSWVLARMIVKVPYISLANLVAGEKVVPEFVQNEVDPRALAREATAILEDDDRRRWIVSQLERVRGKLGPGGASARAADVALTLMGRWLDGPTIA